MHFVNRCVSAAVSWPEHRPVVGPARHYVEVQVIHALPRMRTARIQDHHAGCLQGTRHGTRDALSQQTCCDERITTGVKHSDAVLPGHDKGVTWCKGRVWQREKRNGVVFLDDPSSVTRDEEAAEDAPVITPSHQHTVPDSESKSATMVPGGALPANAAPLPTRPGVMPVI